MAESEVARLRLQIANEYLAAKWGLSGLAAGYSKHQFITVRQERIGMLHGQLRTLVGEDQAIKNLMEALADTPEQVTRQHLIQVLLHEMGDTEESAHLIDWILDMWETIDALKTQFGEETAQTIIEALPYLPCSDVCPT